MLLPVVRQWRVNGVENEAFNHAVESNLEPFPSISQFQLTAKEAENTSRTCRWLTSLVSGALFQSTGSTAISDARRAASASTVLSLGERSNVERSRWNLEKCRRLFCKKGRELQFLSFSNCVLNSSALRLWPTKE
jgi:hypothetical protein